MQNQVKWFESAFYKTLYFNQNNDAIIKFDKYGF